MTTRAILLLAATAAPALAGDSPWPQWRGPNRDATVPGKLPASVGELKQAWAVPLGPSYSGPVLSDKAVFITETVDKKTEVVRALSRDTGEELWKTSWPGAMKVPFFASANGDWIRATPAYDGESLYVAGMRDVLVCLDAATGKERWRVDFTKRYGTGLPAFGFVSSPLIDGDAVYVQAAARLLKLDKKTGKTVWQALSESGSSAYNSPFSSPVIATLAGKRQLVVQTRERLAGVDIESGKELWGRPVKAFRGMNILTPTVIGDRLFTSTYGGGSFLFRVSRRGDKFTIEQLWNNKKQGYMSSPVVIDGHIYLHMRNQRFTCLAVDDGEEKWTTGSFGKYWSTVTDGKKILALDQRGRLLGIDPSPKEFKLAGEQKIEGSETWAHVAVAGDEVYVRSLDRLIKLRAE